MAIKVKDDLKKEIIKDVTKAGHKTITITSDHGTHSDRFHSKENAVTVARTTDDFVIKKDILVMLDCKESQTGKQIKGEVKAALVERACYQEDWKVNWVTDGESKQLNASNPNLNTSWQTSGPRGPILLAPLSLLQFNGRALGGQSTIKEHFFFMEEAF